MSTALWLALVLPHLPVEALALPSSPSAAVARGRIVQPDAAAAQAGVQVGQRLATALGLCPGLLVGERAPPAEAAALHRLACWAGRYTPTLSVKEDGLMLEIGGCLRLFGGLERLLDGLRADLAGQGHRVVLAVAPTPLGARWLALGAPDSRCGEAAALATALDALPCTVPDWPASVAGRLESFGLRRLGEVRRLPGAQLRQRLGEAAVDMLARAYGECPDPQLPFKFPEQFSASLELPSRVEHAEGLAFAAQRLLAGLGGWLQARQSWLGLGSLHLQHERGMPPGVLTLRPGRPTADPELLLRLLRETLARLALAQPVYGLSLSADAVVAQSGDSAALFGRQTAGEGVEACLARLRARLGEDAVQVSVASADHRPEMAARWQPGLPEAGTDFVPGGALTVQGGDWPRSAGGAVSQMAGDTRQSCLPAASPSRPLWLLPAPQPLAERDGRPWWHGALAFLSRPERIESGWWDQGESLGPDAAAAPGDVQRDYFVATNPLGQRLWIFRDGEGWFLHGLFA